VVIAPDIPDLAITIVDNYDDDGDSSSDEEQASVVTVGADAHGLSHSTIVHQSAAPSSSPTVADAPVSRTYSVVPRRQTLITRVSASAAAFANWALRYDNDGAAKY
jgi:hypothetical protein